MTIGERIKSKRLENKMTLLEVANLLGVKEATVQRYESGEIKNLKQHTIARLSEIFHTTPAYLMGWTYPVNKDENFAHDDSQSIKKLKELAPLFNDEKTQDLLRYYNKLNPSGKSEAVKRVSELAEIPKYQKIMPKIPPVKDGEYFIAAHGTNQAEEIRKDDGIIEKLEKAKAQKDIGF